MHLLRTLSILLVCALLITMAAIRLAPSDPARWHVDPRSGAPAKGQFVLRPDGGDAEGRVYPFAPRDLLARFDAVATATPRTHRLAGSLDEGRITYISRSRVFGFPDYTTVEAVAEGTGARLLIFARLRFGGDDLGVNRARVLDWLDALEP